MPDRARFDVNNKPSLIAVSNQDGITPVSLWADPATHGLVISANISGADGAIVDGANGSIKATVKSYTNANPLTVRLSDTNGDYVSAGAGTQYTEDVAAAADPIGTATNLIRLDTPVAITGTDGDNIAQRGTNYGAGYVTLLDKLGVPVPVTDSNTTGSIVANGGTVTATAVPGMAGWTMNYYGTYATGASLTMEASFDGGATYSTVRMLQGATSTLGYVITIAAVSNSTSYFTADIPTGATHLRVRCTAWAAPTGAINIVIGQSVQRNAMPPGAITLTSGTVTTLTNWGNIVDNAAFTDGTTRLSPNGYIYDEVAGTALTENDAAAARIDEKRAQVFILEDGTTRGRRTTVTAGGAILTDASATTQPVSGTVTANAGSGTFTIQSNASVNLAQLAGTATDTNSGVKSAGTLRIVIATDQPQLTNALKVDGSAVTQPVSAASLPLPTGAATSAKQPALGTAGSASTDVLTVQGIASMTALKVDGSGVTQPVSGTITANAGTNLNTSALALDATLAKLTISQGTALGTNTVALIGGSVTTNAPTFTTGQINQLSLTTAGGLRVDLKDTASNTNNLNVNLAASAATVTVSATNLSTNMAQIAGVATATGNGVVGTGVQRVAIASDNTAFSVNATLGAETTKVIGTVRTADGSGNLYTTNSTTYTAKFAQDTNLLGTLGTAFSTAGKVDVKGADGDVFVRQATAGNLNATVVGTGTFAVQAAQSGNWGASNETASVYNGTTALTPKFANITASASGVTTLVAAVTSKKLRVLQIVLIASGTVNVKFQSHVTPTDITGLLYLTTNTGFAPGYSPIGHFQTVAGEALDINLSAAIAVGGYLTYIEV